MRVALFLVLLILLTSCSGDKIVYWCGDHACINKKEKEAYFKKTMIVEKKIINKKNKKNSTKSEEIIKKAKANEKRRIASEKEIEKEKKSEQKRLKKEQKRLAKKTKLEEKKLKKEEKKLAKRIKKSKKKDKDRLINQEKTKIIEHEKITSSSSSYKNVEFKQLKDQIIKKNLIRPYPDINDIPN